MNLSENYESVRQFTALASTKPVLAGCCAVLDQYWVGYWLGAAHCWVGYCAVLDLVLRSDEGCRPVLNLVSAVQWRVRC